MSPSLGIPPSHPLRRQDGDTQFLARGASILNTPVRVRPRSLSDLAAARDLLRRAYPPGSQGPSTLWTEDLMALQARRFPEGQWVATRVDGRLMGLLSTQRVDLARALNPHTWEGITAEGTLSAHEPLGNALYGVGMAVDPAFQGLGIGRLLLETCLEVAERLGCYAALGGVRMAGYRLHAQDLSPQAYLDEVREGRLWDPALSRFRALGFDLLGLLPAYATDPESGGFAALIHRAI
ncbi:MAG TPA: GNAT family N-acetyltransferase [Holophagaceae bacterium]|nr:GNAT family N-acetyltransferase [Holophagaceae bacterium]